MEGSASILFPPRRLTEQRLPLLFQLRRADENSCTIRHRSGAWSKTSIVKTDDIEAVEHSVAIGVQENTLLRSKHPAEFIKPRMSSAPRPFAREFPRAVGAKAC